MIRRDFISSVIGGLISLLLPFKPKRHVMELQGVITSVSRIYRINYWKVTDEVDKNFVTTRTFSGSFSSIKAMEEVGIPEIHHGWRRYRISVSRPVPKVLKDGRIDRGLIVAKVVDREVVHGA